MRHVWNPSQERSSSAGTLDIFRQRISAGIAKAIKDRRIRRGLSQLDLSLKLGRGPKYIWRLENCHAEPDVYEFLSVMWALHADPVEAIMEVSGFEREVISIKIPGPSPSESRSQGTILSARQHVRESGAAMIRHYRTLQGLTQKTLVSRVKGMSQTILSHIENNQQPLKLDEFIELIEACGFDAQQGMKDLISGEWENKTQTMPPKPLEQ